MDFAQVQAGIRAAPSTQIPELMITCIQAGVDKDVWRRGWIDIFAGRIERQYRAHIEQQRQPAAEEK